MRAAPRWLTASVALAGALVAALLWLETQRWRPYYAVGDEAINVRYLVQVQKGEPLHWRWAYSDLQRAAQYGWWRLAGSGPGSLGRLSLLIFAAELALLGLVARRWLGPVGAAWALLADLGCADTWMRARSQLTFEWLPAELLLLAWLSGRVGSRPAALLWAALAVAFVVDYEAALLALPGLAAACLMLEPRFRERWRWVLGGLAGGLALALGLQQRGLAEYALTRQSNSLAVAAGPLLAHWGRNLWQLLAGGEPIPYFSVQHWPAFAPWALPLLGLGAALAWRRGRWAWAAWAALVLGLGQLDRGDYGVPAHRLAGAWPALCLLAGLGGAWVTDRAASPRARGLMLALLALGLAGEADAYLRHMALFGSRTWGRSQNMAAAARLVGAAAPGVAVDSGLLEARYPDLAFHLQPRGGDGREAWVLLPPEYRLLAPGWGEALAVRSGANDEPVLLLKARGPEAARFDRINADLQPLMAASQPARPALAQERAWLAQGGHDERALWLVLGLELRHCADLGEAPSAGDWALLRAHPPLTPAPWAELGRYLAAGEPDRALGAYDKALALDPLYAPAFVRKAELLERLGRADEARAQRRRNEEAQAQGAWTVGE